MTEEFKNFVNGDAEEQTNNEETKAVGASRNSAEEATNINEGNMNTETQENENRSRASDEGTVGAGYTVPADAAPTGLCNKLHFRTYEPNPAVGRPESFTTSYPEGGGETLPMALKVDGVGTLLIGHFREEDSQSPAVVEWLKEADVLARGLWNKFNRTGDEECFGQDLSRALHVKGHIRSDQMFIDLAIDAPKTSQRMIDDPEGVKNAVSDFVDQLSNGEDLSESSYHERWRDFLWFRKRFGRNLAIEDYHEWRKAGRGDELPKVEKNDKKKSAGVETKEEKDAFDGLNEEEAEQQTVEYYLRSASTDFPAPARPEAFYGIAGEVTKAICDGTELKPEAVLAQFLVLIGNMMGRGLHKNQEGRHGTVINVAVVGRTGDGVKGGSLRAVKRLIQAIDSSFFIDKLSGGHNSAEALLVEICDLVEGIGPKGPYIVEEEVPDKRLVVVEEELTRLFAVNSRNGSGMSEMLRQFYDSPTVVKALSRRSKLESTRPHVSIVGHVTPEGLKHSLPSVEAFNGFANRFMFIASQRTRSIPEPIDVDWNSAGLVGKVQYLQQVVKKLHPNEESALNPELEFTFSASGKAKWYELYHLLSAQSAGKSGMAGAMIARAKPTLLRLAIIYAALDLTQEIEREHLEAAYALWEYVLSSLQWAFGENSGNPIADKIHSALQRARKKGMSRTDISEYVFNRRTSSHDITEALSLLKREGKADVRRVPNPTGKGRPVEAWFDINSLLRN